MKKQLLEKFVKKYHLGGLIDAAIWKVKGDKLNVSAITKYKKMFATVTLNDFNECGDTLFGVNETDRLLKLLKTLSDDVSIEPITNDANDVKALLLSSGARRAHLKTFEIAKMDAVPKMKHIPPSDFSITLDDEFKKWLNDSYSAIGTEDTLFTFVRNNDKVEVAMNYIHPNIIYQSQDVPRDSIFYRPQIVIRPDGVKEPIHFSSKKLKYILRANAEFKDPVLNVSNEGLAEISFNGEDIDATYYLVKIDVDL